MTTRRDENKNNAVVMWVEREKRYFVSTYGTTNAGTPIYSSERWRFIAGRAQILNS